MLSFLGFDIVIVATLWPSRCSLMLHLIAACSSLAIVPYDRARLGSSLPWLELRCADWSVLQDLWGELRSNGSETTDSTVCVLKRTVFLVNKVLDPGLHLNVVRAVGQPIISSS